MNIKNAGMLASRLGDHKLIFLCTVFFGLANLGCGIASSGVGAWLVGKAASGAAAATLMPGLKLLAVLVFVAASCIWLESWMAHDLAYRVLATLRGEVYEALARLAPANLVDQRSGDMVSTAMADVETLEWFYAHSIGALFTCTLVPIIVLSVLTFIHPMLPLLLLPLLVLVGIMPALLHRRARARGREMRRELGKLNAEVVDAVQGLKELTIFGAQKRTEERLRQQGKRLISAQIFHGLRAGLESSVSRGFTALGMLATLAFAAWLVSQNKLDPALYPVTVVLAGAVFGPVAGLSGIAGQFGAIGAAATRVFDLINQEPRVTDPENPLSPPVPPVNVRFEDVSFTYEGSNELALDHVSFSLEPGESVALVGHSGAGKSTCSRLLMRYYDPDQGSIKIGDRDLRHMKLEDLRALIAPVPQDVVLFDMSLADNIRLGRPQATDQEVELAARLAAAHSFIAALPRSYDTRAGERGLRFSGGQRQRIAVARAFLSEAPILIMDEAVSNLDTENERILQKALARLGQNRATLVIAHRLSTIKAADRVIVMDRGRIVEEGPPQRLLAANGPLSNLVSAQSLSRSHS